MALHVAAEVFFFLRTNKAEKTPPEETLTNCQCVYKRHKRRFAMSTVIVVSYAQCVMMMNGGGGTVGEVGGGGLTSIVTFSCKRLFKRTGENIN